jgi:hypothetical protein
VGRMILLALAQPCYTARMGEANRILGRKLADLLTIVGALGVIATCSIEQFVHLTWREALMFTPIAIVFWSGILLREALTSEGQEPRP